MPFRQVLSKQDRMHKYLLASLVMVCKYDMIPQPGTTMDHIFSEFDFSFF